MSVRNQNRLIACVACMLSIVWTTYQRNAWGQGASEKQTISAHLVGHEDILLLDRAQDLIDDWDPRKLTNPLVRTTYAKDALGKLVAKKQLRRSDLAEFIADIDAAEALGKAFFWDMRAGSDFRQANVDGEWMMLGTSCATCHFRHGADARSRYTQRPPHVLWDKYIVEAEHDDGYVSSKPLTVWKGVTGVPPIRFGVLRDLGNKKAAILP